MANETYNEADGLEQALRYELPEPVTSEQLLLQALGPYIQNFHADDWCPLDGCILNEDN